MTLTRRIAVKILDAVSRLAPEASQEWIKAMRGELERIPEDWAALAWSLGSVRLLFARAQKRQALSIGDVGRETNHIISTFKSSQTSLGFMGILFSVMGVLRACSHDPVGVGQTLLGISFLLSWIQLRRMHLDEISTDMDRFVEIRQYRIMLIAQRGFSSGGLWAWVKMVLLACAVVCMIRWKILMHPSSHPILAACYGLFLLFVPAIFPLMRFKSNENQRRLEELEALEAREKNL